MLARVSVGVIFLSAAILVVGCKTERGIGFETLISHRGESRDAPENTMPAFMLAVERGFGFECDVHLSGEGEVFVVHDRDLTRTTGGASTNLCDGASWENEVSKLNVGGWGKWKGSAYAPCRPPLLSEVLSLVRKGRYIYVEVKGSNVSIVSHIKRIVEKNPKVSPENVLFISFGEQMCFELKRQMPRYKVYLLTSAKIGGERQLVSKLDELGVDGVDMFFDPKVIDGKFVETVKSAGYSFHVWTVDDFEMASRAFDVGVDTLTTNNARQLLDAYRDSKGLGSKAANDCR